MPIEAMNGLLGSPAVKPAPFGRWRDLLRADPESAFPRTPRSRPLRSKREDAHPGRVVRVDRQRGDGDVGVASMCASISPDSPCGRGGRPPGSGSSLASCALEVPPRLAARRRRCPGTSWECRASARPPGSRRSRARSVHSVRAADVPVERGRVELRQHEDAPHLGVEAVADRHVDEAVLPADRHRRLGAEFGQREQAGSLGRPRGSGPVRCASQVRIAVHARVTVTSGRCHTRRRTLEPRLACD